MNRFGVVFIAWSAALAASAAFAQFPGGGGRQQQPPPGSHIQSPKAQTGSAERSADVPVSLTGQAQVVLDKMEEELRIGAHQQKAWNAYAAKIMRYAEDLARARYSARDMQDGGMSVPQQLDRLGEIASNRLTAAEEIVESGRALYATLGPEQKRTADKMLVLLPLRLVSRSLVGTGPMLDEAPPPATGRKGP